MEKNVLSEISQMKYLFGYKAGVVISEQIKTDMTGDTKPTGFTNADGILYKFPGIGDQAKLEIFINPGKIQDFPRLMGIPQSFADRYVREVLSQKSNEERLSASKADPLWNLVQATRRYLDMVAQQGITPERFKESGVKNWFMSQADPKKFIEVAFREDGGISMTFEEYLDKLSNLVKSKMTQL